MIDPNEMIDFEAPVSPGAQALAAAMTATMRYTQAMVEVGHRMDALHAAYSILIASTPQQDRLLRLVNSSDRRQRKRGQRIWDRR